MQFFTFVLAATALLTATVAAAPNPLVDISDVAEGMMFDLVKRQSCCGPALCARGCIVSVAITQASHYSDQELTS
jgi:hypothetical protein